MATLRTRQAWSALRPQIRRLLLETDSTQTFWSDTLLQDIWNHCMTERALELGEAHDGWLTLGFVTNTVAGQREYAIPEGTERIRGVWLRFESGTAVEEYQLTRDDQIGGDYYQPASGTSFRDGGFRPTYRVVENLLSIEPPDPETRTNGLRLEIDALPPLFDDDNDKLSLLFPMSTEQLLIYDSVLMALGVEDSQGNQEDQQQAHSHLYRFQRRLEAAWRDLIAVRNQSRVYGAAFMLGD